MINIQWILDEEDGIDPIDPIGEIILTDGKTNLIVKSTYLDSWFDALIKGLTKVKLGEKVKVEVMEEPIPLIFEPCHEGVQISYHNQALIFDKLDDFIAIFRLAAEKFLGKIQQIPGWEKNPLLNFIDDFLKNHQ